MKIIKSKNKNMFENDFLGNLFLFHMGGTPKKENDNYSGCTPWVNISDMNKKFIYDTSKKIKKGIVKISKKGSLIGSFKMTVGRFSFLTEDSCTNEAIITIEDCEKVDLNYLYYSLPKFFKKNSQLNGQGLPLLNSKIIKNINYNYHANKAEQKKIASALSLQERQIEIIEELIEKLEKRNQYYAEKLLSGEKRIRRNEKGEIEFYDNTEWQEVSLNGKDASIPKDWIKMKISDFFEINMGQTILSRNISNNNDGNVPVFSATEKFKAFGYIDIKKVNKNRLLKENDLVIGARGTIGSIHKMKYLSTSTQTTIQCRKKEDDNNICFHYMRNYRKSLFKQEGGAIPQLTVYNMNELEIIYNKLESLEINNYLNILIEEKETLEELLIKEKLRFQWMLDNLLSGEYQIVD